MTGDGAAEVGHGASLPAARAGRSDGARGSEQAGAPPRCRRQRRQIGLGRAQERLGTPGTVLHVQPDDGGSPGRADRLRDGIARITDGFEEREIERMRRVGEVKDSGSVGLRQARSPEPALRAAIRAAHERSLTDFAISLATMAERDFGTNAFISWSGAGMRVCWSMSARCGSGCWRWTRRSLRPWGAGRGCRAR